jgi:hypothetical protein
MEENKNPVQGVVDGSPEAKKQKGMFDKFLEPGDRTPEKNRILFMCVALFLAAIAVITLISFFQ